MAQCLSCLGPPPGCGHEPTPEQPICASCRESHERYVREIRENAIRSAKRTLEGFGYTVIDPAH